MRELMVGSPTDPRIIDVLRGSRVMHSTALTREGPHLTPTAFSWAVGRLWIVASKRSVTVRALRQDRRIGVLLAAGSHHVVGTATVWDPTDSSSWPGIDDVIRGPFGATRYLAENLGHAISVVADTPTPRLVLDRVAVSISLERTALVEGSELVGTWGPWPGPTTPERSPGTSAPARGRFALPVGTPAIARRLLETDRDAQLGWASADGPLALPVHWSAAGRHAAVSAGLVALTGLPPEAEACLTLSTSGHRMSEKRGVLVRGPGRAVRTVGDAVVRVTPRMVTTWAGQRVTTARRASGRHRDRTGHERR